MAHFRVVSGFSVFIQATDTYNTQKEIMSANNRTRNSKKSKHLLNLELSKAETLFEPRTNRGKSALKKEFKKEVEAEEAYWIRDMSFDEYTATISRCQSNGIDLIFNWERKRQRLFTQGLRIR